MTALPEDPAEAASVAQIRARNAVLVALGAIAGFVLLVATIYGVSSVVATNKVDKQSEQIGKLGSALDSQGRIIEQLTGVKQPTAEQVIGVPVEGKQGLPGLNATPEMVATAVAAYMIEHPAQNGHTPTNEELTGIVAAYCASIGGCVGANGTNGQNGTDAPPVTPSQLAAAVADYCAANNNCAGPAGADGQPGTMGATGPTPQGPFDCDGDVTNFDIINGTAHFNGQCNTTTTTTTP